MRATNQQSLISPVFEVAERATNDLTPLVSDLNRDRTEYALASVLLEEAWISSRWRSEHPREANPAVDSPREYTHEHRRGIPRIPTAS
ncbi:hypothetical protein SAMN02910418_01748 [Bowdeniella nasicola]|uniref:Uncharacterized protein n=1 Tax=Bowdeniella nasicola TaxID=208480 RepID=A0A1H4BR34_9ACTO|nr:hypothetical protein SAMN02910418_01748 [Bowdeniella nasicola]